MKIVFLTIGLIALLPSHVFGQLPGSAASDSIVKLTSARSSDKIVVIHVALGECVSCVLGLQDAMDCIRKRMPQLHVKVIAALISERKAEIGLFRKNYDWSLPIIQDRGELKSQLGLPSNTRISILNAQGRVLAHISDEDYLHDRCDQILRALRK